MKSAGGQIPLQKNINYEDIVVEIKKRLIRKIKIKATEVKTI